MLHSSRLAMHTSNPRKFRGSRFFCYLIGLWLDRASALVVCSAALVVSRFALVVCMPTLVASQRSLVVSHLFQLIFFEIYKHFTYYYVILKISEKLL